MIIRRRSCRAFALPMLLAALLGPSLRAELVVVNSTADAPDADARDGVCDADLEAEGLQCTLRAAIMHANATLGPDEIMLPAGLYRLDVKGGAEDLAATGDLDVLDELTLTGAGAGTTIIDGKKAKDRVLDVYAATSMTAVTIRKGKTPVDDGGGGGIRAFADLTLTDVVVTRNRSLDDGGGVELLDAMFTLTRCSVSRNVAKDDGAGIDVDDGDLELSDSVVERNKAGDEGAGLENSAGTTLMTNVTIALNRAKTEGAALSLEDGSTTMLLNCTLAKNRSKADGNIAIEAGKAANTVTMQNTLLYRAGKKKPNCVGEVTSIGGNLENGADCFGDEDGSGDLSGVDPRLDQTLRDNGGPTLTMALREDSPAIDAGLDAGCPPADQRGVPRVDVPEVGVASCDVGAYEFEPAVE